MQELSYHFMVKVLETLHFIPNSEKALQLSGETASQYKSRLFKRSGELYGMLHNRPKNDPAPMSKEEILREMDEITKLKDQVFELEKKRHPFGL